MKFRGDTLVLIFILVFGVVIAVQTALVKNEEKQVQDVGLSPNQNSLSFDSANVYTQVGSNGEILNSRINSSLPQYNGYIIKFKEKSLIEKKVEVEKQAKSLGKPFDEKATLASQEQIIANEHNSFKQKLSSGFGKPGQVVPKITGEFKNTFNGIALNISDAEVSQIKSFSEVVEVYPNYEVHTTLMDSVPLIQGGVPAGQLDNDGNDCVQSGKTCLTGKGVTIGIIDTGVDYTHEDLGGCFGNGCKVVEGYDFSGDIFVDDLSLIIPDSDPMDYMGHGTHVAATAAGNGGFMGVAPEASIYAYKVFPNSYSSVIISAIERSVDPNQDGDFSDHLDVISLSLGGLGNPDDSMSTAIDNAVDAGVVSVIAAGNSGPRKYTIDSPGTARKAITVGAVDKQDNIASFSSRGPVIWWASGNEVEKVIIKPDILAPGVNICAAQWQDAWAGSECLDDNHVTISGTSMATPHVSGAVAIIKQAHPDWAPEEIKSSLKSMAKDLGLSSKDQGNGRIEVEKALKLIERPLIAELSETNYIVVGVIDILGTARGDNFQKYEVYYSKEGEENWNLICVGNQEVEEGILCGGFDTSIIDQGTNELKLVVYGGGYNIESFGLVNLKNFYVEAIDPYFTKQLKRLELFVKWGNYDSFSVYARESFGSGIYGSWQRLDSEITYSRFLDIDLSSLRDGKYQFKVVAEKQGIPLNGDVFIGVVLLKSLGNTGGIVETFSVEPSAISVEDINNERHVIVFENYHDYLGGGWYRSLGYLGFYRHLDLENVLGTLQDNSGNNYYQGVNGHHKYTIYPNNEKPLLVVSSSAPEAQGDVRGWHRRGVIGVDGTYLENWPKYLGKDLTDYHFDNIVVQNGKIIFPEEYQDWNAEDFGDNVESFEYRIKVFDRDANILSEFFYAPFVNKDLTDINSVFFGGEIISFNEAGKDYFVFSSKDGVSFEDGSEDIRLNLRLYDLKSKKLVKDIIISRSDLANPTYFEPRNTFIISENSKAKIILPVDTYTHDISSGRFLFSSYFFIFDSNGNELNRFSFDGGLSSEVAPLTYNGKIYLTTILSYSDFDKKLAIFDLFGNLFDEFSLDVSTNTPLYHLRTADMDNDDVPEIIFLTRPRFYGNDLGSVVKSIDVLGGESFTLNIPNPGYEFEEISDLVISDSNSDGKTDILITTSAFSENLEAIRGSLWVIDTGKEYNSSRMYWPQSQHDAQHTGCYDCDKQITLSSPQKIKPLIAECTKTIPNSIKVQYLPDVRNYPLNAYNGNSIEVMLRKYDSTLANKAETISEQITLPKTILGSDGRLKSACAFFDVSKITAGTYFVTGFYTDSTGNYIYDKQLSLTSTSTNSIVASPTRCTDSVDNGKNYLVKGTSSGFRVSQAMKQTDSCSNGKLLEWYCKNPEPNLQQGMLINLAVETYDCSKIGKKCSDGKCV